MTTEQKLDTDSLLSLIRDGKPMSLRQQLRLTALLSFPAIMAQLSAIAMQYIDASMVGSLGAGSSAAIGLVSTSTWLFWGLLSAAATGFSVQVAHKVGASDFKDARKILRQSFTAMLLFSGALALLGMCISPFLPSWLRGDATIHQEASGYFFIFSLFLPALQLNFLAGAMLRCAGNMRVPSMLNVFMCVMDVIFNFIFIFPSREIHLLGSSWHLWGAGLGVEGAALGTVLAETITASLMMWYLCRKSSMLRLVGEHGSYRLRRTTSVKALRIGLPIGLEHAAICSAQILITVIVAPLGVVAIAANAFAIIAESLCYMPGYGIAEAATTLAGQSLGAGRMRLLRRFGNITVLSGMAIMGIMGMALYVFAPQIIGVMSPVDDIRVLGTDILRIEAWAEPMFAAAIVTYGFFVGMGRTVVPSVVNLVSIWGIRLTMAAWLAPTLGLRGVWLAMCVELSFRGAMFLVLLWRGNWRHEKDKTILNSVI